MTGEQTEVQRRYRRNLCDIIIICVLRPEIRRKQYIHDMNVSADVSRFLVSGNDVDTLLLIFEISTYSQTSVYT